MATESTGGAGRAAGARAQAGDRDERGAIATDAAALAEQMEALKADIAAISATLAGLVKSTASEGRATIERTAEHYVRQGKRQADAAKQIKSFDAVGIAILNGRYGPYVTDGSKNARVPKDVDPATLDLEQCRTLLESAPAKRGPRRGKARKA